MTRYCTTILGIWLILFGISHAQVVIDSVESPLQAGPMIGYVAMREAHIWVQTRSATNVNIEYWDINTPDEVYHMPEISTESNNAFIATFVVAPLEPGRKYGYQVLVDGEPMELAYATEFSTPPLWQFRTEPPTVRIALGSCNYVNDSAYDRPGQPFGRSFGIFDAILQQKPNIMLWLGDNTYLREADYDSRTGILYRYTHTRSLPQLQALLASVQNIATWDDHDYGPNDADGSYLLKHHSLEAFKLFWPNPSYGMPDLPGVFTSCVWGDVQIFTLDNRWYRSAPGLKYEKGQMLGEAQIQWLLNALKASKASLKLVAIGGQLLNPAPVFENMSRYFGPERHRIIQAIRNEQIDGVVFLSGDRHHTELSVLQPGGSPDVAYPLYELTVSPLTAGPSTADISTEANTLRVPDTAVRENNFGILEITGPLSNRVLSLTILNASGGILWRKSLNINDLKVKK